MSARLPRRAFLGSGLAVLAGAVVAPALGVPLAGASTVKQIWFPVDGPVRFTDTFGACRGVNCERAHQGQDLLGRKMQPLLAAVDGTITRAELDRGISGNTVTLRGRDGWTYHYVHLNNDTPGTNDNSNPKGKIFGPGIKAGVTVVAGQVVGYMGDSGNAEGTTPHLHFEIRRPDGTPINPYASLIRAQDLQFVDVPAEAYFYRAVHWMALNGITTGVGGSKRFEPHRAVTRAEWATFLWRSAGRPASAGWRFDDVRSGAYYEPAVSWLRARGLTTGVGGANRFAPDRTLTRAELVTMLWRDTGQVAAASPVARFGDVAPGTFYATAVDWATAEGITTGVGGNRFDPDGVVTRAQAATFLWRHHGQG